MSPELYSFHNYNNAEITFKTDIWSAGIIIFEMINLKMPIPSPIFNTDTPDDLKLIVNL
jgi:serine/threonine protein kinase